MDDLASRIDNLEDVDPYEHDCRLSDVESDVDDICSTLDFDLELYAC